MHLIVSSQRSRKFSCSTVRNFSCKRPDMQVKLRWHRSMSPQDAKLAFARAIQAAFKEIVRKNKGKLAQKAAEIGVERQQLEQYASGTVPRSDVILTAMIIIFSAAAFFTGRLYGRTGMIAVIAGFVVVVTGLYTLGGLHFG